MTPAQTRFLAIGVACLGVGLIAYELRSTDETIDTDARSKGLYPELADRMEGFEHVSIQRGSGREAVTLDKGPQRWGVAQRGGYPANIGPLREAFVKLARAERVEPKTERPERYGMLGLDPAAEGARTLVLRAWSGSVDETPDLHLYVGDTGVGGGDYVRRADAAQTWLISESIELPSGPQAWLDSSLADLDPAAWQTIQVRPANGDAAFRLTRATENDTWRAPDEPAGTTVDANAADRLARALQGLQLTDVAPDDQRPKSEPRQVTWTAEDGLTVRAQYWRTGDNDTHQVMLEADHDPAAAREPAKTDTAAADNATAGPEAAEDPTRDPMALAEQLEARWSGWVYEIASRTGDALAQEADAVLTRPVPEVSEPPSDNATVVPEKPQAAQPTPARQDNATTAEDAVPETETMPEPDTATDNATAEPMTPPEPAPKTHADNATGAATGDNETMTPMDPRPGAAGEAGTDKGTAPAEPMTTPESTPTPAVDNGTDNETAMPNDGTDNETAIPNEAPTGDTTTSP